MFHRLLPARFRKSSRRRLPLDLPQIRTQAAGLRPLSDAQFTAAASDLRATAMSPLRDNASNTASNTGTSAFAFAAEAVRRATGKTYYDVQLTAGGVLARGDLAEMQTGEGKTLVTLLPVFAAVVGGHNVHVATTNSYLAARDCEELRPAFELLGVNIGLLPEENDEAAKRRAYACDVTYGTGYEFGFDYLRDQLALRNQPADRLGDTWLRALADCERPQVSLVQSDRATAIVDEIDSVLIDEANTPLVISFFASEGIDIAPYRRAAGLAATLENGTDYRVETARQQITLTQSGSERIAAAGGAGVAIQGAGVALQRPWRVYVEQALRAEHLLQRDVDYVVRDGKVALVDGHTGRIFAERKWRDGLHQAVEFREQVALTPETHSFARISRQRFFKLYPQATGMTGTAVDALDEFHGFFGLQVVPIPLNRPSQRLTLPTRWFCDGEAKLRAIVTETLARHRAGQPVLIGTRTIQQSRAIADLLAAAGLPLQMLNGIQDAEEAAIIAAAGAAGSVTVATNMAGRGTDIKLTPAAREAGGLHVIAAEPNRSRRVDRQLIGRCGRQGDPGSCGLFVAADDELLATVGTALARRIRKAAGRSGETSIPRETELRSLQRQAEAIDYARRQHLMQQELWTDGILQTLVGEGTAA